MMLYRQELGWEVAPSYPTVFWALTKPWDEGASPCPWGAHTPERRQTTTHRPGRERGGREAPKRAVKTVFTVKVAASSLVLVAALEGGLYVCL